MPELDPLPELERAQLVRRTPEGRLEPTRRWQSALARAAFRLMKAGDPNEDERIAYASALIEIFGDDADDHELAQMVEALLELERRCGLEVVQPAD
jgi:hypothetical protein